jgi:hypothetical protein
MKVPISPGYPEIPQTEPVAAPQKTSSLVFVRTLTLLDVAQPFL